MLSMLGTREQFNEKVSAVVNPFAGQLVKVVCSEEPGLYAIGTLEMAPAYDPLTGKGQLTISCSDGDSYRYHVNETVVPVITATADTALSWQVGTDTFQKSVSPGTWEFPEMELQAGRNVVFVTGTGTVTFRYREGRL